MNKDEPIRVNLSSLCESPFNPRTHYNEVALRELAESITTHGILQPILVRPIEEDRYQIVAGHRRSRAAKLAGLIEVPVLIREIDENEARKLQLVENIHRADLSPMEEADSYAELLAATGITLHELGRLVSRTPERIARRLALRNLAPLVQKYLAAGILSVGHAELIARIPNTKLQKDCLGEIIVTHQLPNDDTIRSKVAKPLAFVRQIVEGKFMTTLAAAPFDPEDPTLSPLGKCSICSYRSGNDRDLFGDVRGTNVCTNLVDYELKVQNWLLRLREEGKTVLISPEEIREAFPYQTSHPSHLYYDLDAVCYLDDTRRLYRDLITDEMRENIIYAFAGGKLRMLFPRERLEKFLADEGMIQARSSTRVPDTLQKEIREKQKLERAIREAVASDFAKKVAAAEIEADKWIDLLARGMLADRGWTLDDVIGRHGYEGTKKDLGGNLQKIALKLIEEMSDNAKRAFVLDAFFSTWASPQSGEQRKRLHKEAMTLFGVDARAIEKRVRRELKTKANKRKTSSTARKQGSKSPSTIKKTA